MKLYFYWTKMTANGVKEYSAICSMMFIILCLLCSMPCATTLKTDSHNQSSNNFTSPSLQSFSSGTINADGGRTAVREPSSCDITLEKGPKNKTRNEGERVSLICDLIDENDQLVVWRYSGPGIRRHISINDFIYDEQDRDNYKVSINKSSQTYKLIIKSATFPTDSGTYQCGYACNSISFVPLASAVVTILPNFDLSPSCQMNLLPSLASEADGDTFEVICFWTHYYEGNAHFENANGEDVQIHLTFPGRIISRIKANNVPNIKCQFMFSTSSSETKNALCIGNESTGMLRVDPFINKVTMNSKATFKCTFLNQRDSHKGSWKIHYGANVSLVSKENLIESQKVISIVNVSESHQSILVECALSVSDNVKISSFGTIRIARMTTTPPDENPTQWTINNISKTTTDISENRPTTTSTLLKATSISVTSPLTAVATTTTGISGSTRPTTATRMPSEATTMTASQTSAATTPNIGTPQTPSAPICKFYLLPYKGSLDRDSEVVCSWNHSQAYQAQLQRSDGETIDNSFTFANRIISRVKFSGSSSITCRLSLKNITSMAEMNTSCLQELSSFIRVDPFIDQIHEGSSALFNCTFNNRGIPSELSWKVHPSGILSAVDLEKSRKYPNVNFSIHEQKGGEYLIVECQLHGDRNISSYGLLRIIKGTTFSLSTTSGASPTSQMTSSRAAQTLESTTEQNDITGTQPSIKKTTVKVTPSIRDGQTALITDKSSVQTVRLTTNHKKSYGTNPSFKVTTLKTPTSSPGRQTSQIMDNTTTTQPYTTFSRSLVVTDNTSVPTTEYTMDQINASATNSTPSSTKRGLVVMISISVLVAVVILLLSLIIVYLLRKQKRMSLPRRLSEDDKTDKIELSNIPHILHEESSEWYALSFKDKRVQDIQGQQSNDHIVKPHDESDQNIPILSSSLGIPSLHLLESIDENVYAEPDVSEEPIRQTISRQQCTFTPLLEDEQ